MQTRFFRSAKIVPGARAWWLSGPGGWLVTAHQTHVDDWEIAARYGVAAAVPSDFSTGPADSEARGQARWIDCIVWLDDFAGALAVARYAALLGFSGPQGRKGCPPLGLLVPGVCPGYGEKERTNVLPRWRRSRKP